MKSLKQFYSLLLIFSVYTVPLTLTSDPLSVGYTIGWLSAVTIDSFSAASEQIRHSIYGSSQVPQPCENAIRSVISTLRLQQPTDIKQAYQPWTLFAGHLFSNQDTLFISEQISHDIAQLITKTNASDILSNLNTQNKKELITSLLMITSDYDNKVLALSIISPLSVWIIARITHSLMKKIRFLTPFNPVTHISYKIAKKFRNSFIAKSLVSASIVGAYILYQRYLFNAQAQILLTSKIT